MLDIIGSIIIGGSLLLMMMTFQLQMQESSSRIYYTGSMIEHIDNVADNLNHVFSMVGIGFNIDDTVCQEAKEDRIKFKTYWNYGTDSLDDEEHIIEIKLNDSGDDFGRVLNVLQDGEVLHPLGHLMFIEDMRLKYFNKNDALIPFSGSSVASANLKGIMSAEVLLTFRRDSPWRPEQPLRTNLQLKCFFMNRYLQEGAWN